MFDFSDLKMSIMRSVCCLQYSFRAVINVSFSGLLSKVISLFQVIWASRLSWRFKELSESVGNSSESRLLVDWESREAKVGKCFLKII